MPAQNAMTRLTTTIDTVPCHPAISNWLGLIQAEYREMPCLSLTKPQMRRLWGLESHACDALVEALLDARVLRRRLDGAYVAIGSSR
jgi:hypothetical protein